MARVHNKKRNVGLLYEFLVRHVAECLVEGRDKPAKSAVRLLKKHILKKGTELYKEFRLFHALANTTVESEHTASLIIQEARAACRKYDAKRLDREKSLLIRGINHTFNDPNFYDKRLEEYKIYATIQTMLNEWRKETPSDISRLTQYEQEVIKWLVTEKKKNVLEEAQDGVDDLLVNLMVKKVNNRYTGMLNPEQISLIKKYVYAERTGDQTDLKKAVLELRDSALGAVSTYMCEQKQHSELTQQLEEVKALISKEVDVVDDGVLTRFLRVAKLKEEILGGE